jgi:hypothetical protein
MPRAKIDPAPPDTLDAEIARLRDLDVAVLRARWHTCLAICSIVSWRTGCRPTSSAIWTLRGRDPSTARKRLRGQVGGWGGVAPAIRATRAPSTPPWCSGDARSE